MSLSRLLVVSFASCGSSPMQDACLSCHRPPSCAIPVRQRGSFIMTPCPRQCLATYFIPSLAQPSCVPLPPPSAPSATHSSTVVLLRPSSLRPFTTLPPELPTHRPVVSPSPSLPQKIQVAQPQPRRLIDHPCVTCLPLNPAPQSHCNHRSGSQSPPFQNNLISPLALVNAWSIS